MSCFMLEGQTSVRNWVYWWKELDDLWIC